MERRRVYVIQREDGLVKIGVSHDPELRVRILESQGGFTAVSRYCSSPYDNAFQIESVAHAYFKERRAKGEWFAVDFEVAWRQVERIANEIGEIVQDERPPMRGIKYAADVARQRGLSDREKQILETFGKVIPELSDLEKEKLLSFGEGMAFKAQSGSGKPGCAES